MASSKNKPRDTESRDTKARDRGRARDTKFKAGRFDYQRLDAYKVALRALELGEQIAKQLPRGYGKLRDQLRRALLSSYLNIAEGPCRPTGKRLDAFGLLQHSLGLVVCGGVAGRSPAARAMIAGHAFAAAAAKPPRPRLPSRRSRCCNS